MDLWLASVEPLAEESDVLSAGAAGLGERLAEERAVEPVALQVEVLVGVVGFCLLAEVLALWAETPLFLCCRT